MMKTFLFTMYAIFFIAFISSCGTPKTRSTEDFNKDWKFNLGDVKDAQDTSFNDNSWRLLNLPHDWSIEGEFSDKNPATPGGGALPGGIGWYRKTFTVPLCEKEKLVYIDFDGIYRNSEVWINNHYLGKRPYGYSSFRYELTPYINFGDKKNIIAVKVDNSQQPNSRWYSGSGIYRNVWLVITNKIAVDHWGTFITTPEINEKSAKIIIKTKIRNTLGSDQSVKVKTIIYDSSGNKVASIMSSLNIPKSAISEFDQETIVESPVLWSVDKPYLYKAISQITNDNKVCDEYTTTFGIRYFKFDREKGFSLNGQPIKIRGVCDHHDLGCLGAAINTRAIERQLELLKGMGCNGVRTSHNPPAPELLNLCDKMGFIVMDEAFDMWMKKKTTFDYAADFDQWHVRDLEDLVLRDRNHASVFIWSIGNEIIEQWDTKDTSGVNIAKALSAIVKNLDSTRPVTSACNNTDSSNAIIKSGALDLIGFNYGLDKWPIYLNYFPCVLPFIGTETTSALATRGSYDMPSDSVRRWPKRWDIPFNEGNSGNTCSSYDNCSAPWGSTQEESWKLIKKYDYLSGMYIWTGFDYLGEPTPYGWPSRSSYFGIIDLAGFPKDAYYMYQSEWTNKPVLHILPHWNWKQGEIVDVWVYSSNKEVELFLNGKSLGTKQKTGEDLHLQWKVPYEPGVLKAVAYKDGKEVQSTEVKTAGDPFRINLSTDRSIINADGKDLSFITIDILDKDGNIVPKADNLVKFQVTGEGFIAGVDNGCQISMESFKADYRKAFNGKCLVVIKSKEKTGKIKLTATSDGLEPSSVIINVK